MNATVTPMRTRAEDALAASFETLLKAEKAKPDSRLPLRHEGVLALRRKAMADFLRLGLPHRRIEAWKYTDLRALLRDVPPPPRWIAGAAHDAADAVKPVLALAGVPALLFVDGFFQPSGKLPEGAEFELISDLLDGQQHDPADLFENAAGPDDAMIALNRAFSHCGARIRIVAGARLSSPLHFVFAESGAAPRMLNQRLIVEVGAGAEATIIESHQGSDGAGAFINTLCEFRVADGARLEHVRLNASASGTTSVSTQIAWLGAGADFSSLNIAIGGAVSRHQAFVTCAGAGAKLSLRGATLARGIQHMDATLVVDHAEPACESRELFRTVLDGKASGVFQGKITVRPKAQKTDGRMAANAILLSDDAAMSNKPELEIFADDVQCAHGVTCGALDDDLVFYLMARGIPRKEAEALMIASFLGQTIEPVSHEGLRDELNGQVAKWLAERAAA